SSNKRAILMKARFVGSLCGILGVVMVAGCASSGSGASPVGARKAQRTAVALPVQTTDEAALTLQNLLKAADQLGSQFRAGGAVDKAALACSCGGGVRPVYLGGPVPAGPRRDPIQDAINVLQVVEAARKANKPVTIGPAVDVTSFAEP